MKSAGQILKEARIKKKWSLEKVAEVTKIRPLYLQALEDSQFQKLPSTTSAHGFVKNYAECLNLNPQEVLALFRRDYDERKIAREDASLKAAPSSKFNWTPKLTTLIGLGILAALFIFYLIWQYTSLISAPYY